MILMRLQEEIKTSLENLSSGFYSFSMGWVVAQKVIKELWASDEPGAILGAIPGYRQVLGWHELSPMHCSGCSFTTLFGEFRHTIGRNMGIGA